MSVELIAFAGPDAVQQRSTFTLRAKFRDAGAFVDVVPTNVYYRLDDESGCVLTDWTALPGPMAASMSLVLTGEQNRIIVGARDAERKTLSMMVDRGLATQFVGAWSYLVRNLGWTS